MPRTAMPINGNADRIRARLRRRTNTPTETYNGIRWMSSKTGVLYSDVGRIRIINCNNLFKNEEWFSVSTTLSVDTIRASRVVRHEERFARTARRGDVFLKLPRNVRKELTQAEKQFLVLIKKTYGPKNYTGEADDGCE